MSVEKQIAIIYLGTRGLLTEIPVEKIKQFEDAYVTYLEAHNKELLNDLKAGKLTDEMTATMEKIGADMSKQYKTA